MAAALPLLVFTDLDGTLIAHDTYSWAAARPALEVLHRLGAGLVMASSKTAPEIAVLRAAVGFSHWPAIVENGAGVLAAGCDDAGQGGHYRSLRAVLDALPARLRKHYRGFGDMTGCPTGVFRAGALEWDAALAHGILAGAGACWCECARGGAVFDPVLRANKGRPDG
jgi:mannosyl-3-phosphoglycerate phosphatase